jgi:hypothetical protein
MSMNALLMATFWTENNELESGNNLTVSGHIEVSIKIKGVVHYAFKSILNIGYKRIQNSNQDIGSRIVEDKVVENEL